MLPISSLPRAKMNVSSLQLALSVTSLAVIEPVSCRLERPPNRLLRPALEEESLRPEPRLGIREDSEPRPLSLLDPPREPRLLRSPRPLPELGRRDARAPRPLSLLEPPREPRPLRPLSPPRPPLPELGMREARPPRPPSLPDPPRPPLPALGIREDRAPRPLLDPRLPNWRFSMVLVGAPRAAPTKERAITVFMMVLNERRG